MARGKIYVGVEIGTSKMCVVVGEVNPDENIKILGVGQAPSRGVRKGEICDFETAKTCLHDALVRAEDRSDVMVRNVMLSVTGSHVASLNNRGSYLLPEGQDELTEEDLDEVESIVREVDMPQQNVFLHSIIRHYYVDGQEGVVNPVGMMGSKLEADYHIIHGVRSRIQNSIRCVREIPLEVSDAVFAPIAAAQVVLGRDAKISGALVIDIGGGTSDYVAYADGVVSASGCVAIGGDHISNDLSVVLNIPLREAEKLKVREGSAEFYDGPEDQRIVRLEGDNTFGGIDVDRVVLNEVIHMRVREIMEHVYSEVAASGALERNAGGVYLTGGSSLLRGIDTVVEDVFGMPVRRTNAVFVSGLNATFENPQYATAIGLIHYAHMLDQEAPATGPIALFKNCITGMLNGVRCVLGLF
jgi:cell division protein FtsA